MRYISFVLALSVWSCTAWAQSQVAGIVLDMETKEALQGVQLQLSDSKTTVISSSEGAFRFFKVTDNDSVLVRYMGYLPQKVKVLQDRKLTIAMERSSTNMEEVVVSGSRQAQLREDVPMAINKLSTTVISDTKATQLVELVNKVPGVAMVNYNNEQHGMGIRQPMGTNAYFLYMEDGIPLRPMGVFNHNALIEMNLFAVSSIEVVKGPASSLYGSEAVGGVINFITQRPTAVTSARAGIQFNNYGYKRVQYGAGGMIDKKLGFYVGGFYARQENSWMTYSDFNKNSVNARFDYSLNSRTKFIIAGAFNDYYSDTPGSVDSIAFYNRQYVSTSDFTYRKVKSLRVRLSAEHNWNHDNQTTVHAVYRDNTIAQNPSYGIKWKAGSSAATGEINDNSFTSEAVIVQHTAKVNFLNAKLIGGASIDASPVTYDSYAIDLDTKFRSDGKSAERFIFRQERPDSILADYDANLLNSATFLQAEIKPLKNLSISIGGRYDEMLFTYTNYLDKSSGKKSFHQFTPKLGIAYKIIPQAGLYANYSRGFSPPGLTSIFRRKPKTEPAEFYYNLAPAEFSNYEVGGWLSLIKSKLDIDFAAYLMPGKNELLNIRQADNSTDFQSAGKTQHKGVEYGITYRPDKQWMLRFSGTNALHRYDEFILSTAANAAIKDVNNKIMQSAPSFIANSEVVYKPKFVKNLRTGIEWERMSSWYQNQINTVSYNARGAFGLKGISVLNLRAGYQIKGIELFSNIMNITNELYAYSATRGNSSTDRSTFNAAAPRTFVFGIQYNFTAQH